jgi:hypothetical protein
MIESLLKALEPSEPSAPPLAGPCADDDLRWTVDVDSNELAFSSVYLKRAIASACSCLFALDVVEARGALDCDDLIVNFLVCRGSSRLV